MNRYLSPPLLFRLVVLLMVTLIIAGLAISAASASIQACHYSVSLVHLRWRRWYLHR